MVDTHVRADKNSAILLGVTEGGKDINLVRRTNSSIRIIEFSSGGRLPKQLEGGFSSTMAAQAAVDNYLAKVAAKEIKVDGTKYAAKAAK